MLAVWRLLSARIESALPTPRAVYADITWVGYTGTTVPARFTKAFTVICEGRDAAVALVHWRGRGQDAVDLALPMAVDCEYRVAEAAREALVRHGLQPSEGGVATGKYTLRQIHRFC